MVILAVWITGELWGVFGNQQECYLRGPDIDGIIPNQSPAGTTYKNFTHKKFSLLQKGNPGKRMLVSMLYQFNLIE